MMSNYHIATSYRLITPNRCARVEAPLALRLATAQQRSRHWEMSCDDVFAVIQAASTLATPPTECNRNMGFRGAVFLKP